MQIVPYSGRQDDEIVSLILSIQNTEAKIHLSLEEQPDLLDISRAYQQNGGQFWLAIENGRVIGTIGLMRKEKDCAVLKKFFVKREYRAQGIGWALYCALLAYAKAQGIKQIFLDTPSVAHASHRFYERAGFRKIDAGQLPVAYSYPDRNSLLYLLDL